MKGNKRMRTVTLSNPHAMRVVPEPQATAMRIELSLAMVERQEREAQIRAMARRPSKGDSANWSFAEKAIERVIVRGLWVLEISQTADGPRRQHQHGIGYLPEYLDHYGTVASGGKWDAGPVYPPVPSGKEIDAAREAQSWIGWLDEDQARLLNYAAITKRGEVKSGVNWDRVKARLRLPDDFPIRTLQDRYKRALRTIVAELTLRRVA